MNANDPNIAVLETAVRALGDLRHQLVLVGGCAVGLLITDAASAPVRATVDVDLIAEVATLLKYRELAAHLEGLGFSQPMEEADHYCRWVRCGLKLDIMPSTADVLGHSVNRWYPQVISTARHVNLPCGLDIRVVDSPYFLATKLEAFYDLGGGDYSASHDIEDIINVVDGRPELGREVHAAAPELRDYIREEFDELLSDRSFVGAIPHHLRGDAASQARAPLIIDRLRGLAGL